MPVPHVDRAPAGGVEQEGRTALTEVYALLRSLARKKRAAEGESAAAEGEGVHGDAGAARSSSA
jgi:hypothetical protein